VGVHSSCNVGAIILCQEDVRLGDLIAVPVHVHKRIRHVGAKQAGREVLDGRGGGGKGSSSMAEKKRGGRRAGEWCGECSVGRGWA